MQSNSTIQYDNLSRKAGAASRANVAAARLIGDEKLWHGKDSLLPFLREKGWG